MRVRAAALNRADLYMLQGTYAAGSGARGAFTAGLELAGEVEALGAGVERPKVRDRVMGLTLGAFAPFALVDHRHLLAAPSSLGWTETAALPVGLATTTSESKTGALADVGADVVVNTRTASLPEVVGHATDGAGVDIVLDHAGGALFADALAATRVGGTLVNIRRLAGPKSTIDLDQLSFRRLTVRGTTFGVRSPEEIGEMLAALVPTVLPAVGAGRIRPVVDSVVPFEQAQRAADRLRANEATGKIVLEMP